MIFIVTCSEDGTTDLLEPFFREEGFSRFNIDRYKECIWDFSREGFRFLSQDGIAITEKTLSAFYLRKPMFFDEIEVPKGGCLENWCREEVQDAFRSLYHECAAQNLCALVHPTLFPWRKVRQMKLASRYFPIPEWHVFSGSLAFPTKERGWVFKTLTQTRIGTGRYPFVRDVDPKALAPEYPWFIQEKVGLGTETTVVYVNGRLFPFTMKTDADPSVDSRKAMTTPGATTTWIPTDLSVKEISSIRGFMSETGLDFGRFDFIRDRNGTLWFLELNPNGQWAWLDEKNEYGLLQAVADEILAVSQSGRRLQWS